MPLPLDKTLKREIVLDGRPHTVTVSPQGVRLTAKGFRKGRELTWAELWAVALPESTAGGTPAAPDVPGAPSGASSRDRAPASPDGRGTS